MGVNFFQLYWTKEGTTTEVLLNDIIDWNIKKGIEAKQNFLKINLKNLLQVKNNTVRRKFINVDGTFKFKEGDTLTLYYDTSAITKASSQLIMTGVIHEIGGKVDGSSNISTLNSRDKTYLLLNKLWSKHYPAGTIDTAPETIVSVIQSSVMKEDGSGYYITTNNVATLRQDSSAFPTLDSGTVPSIEMVNKTIYEWIQTLSQVDYTGENRPYLFWIDDDNDLHWVYPTQTSAGTLTEGKQEILNFDASKSAEGAINMIIFASGKDKKGDEITGYYFDNSVKTKQFAFKFQPMEDISRDYRKGLEVARNTLNEGGALSAADTTITLTDASSFSASGTIRIDDEFIDYSGKSTNNLTGCTRGVDGTPAAAHDDGTAVIDETTYATMSNDDYKDACKTRAKARCKRIIQEYAGLRWHMNVVRKGKCEFGIGDLVSNTFPSLGFSSQLLRIHDIQYLFNRSGVTHTLILEEDVEAISAGA